MAGESSELQRDLAIQVQTSSENNPAQTTNTDSPSPRVLKPSQASLSASIAPPSPHKRQGTPPPKFFSDLGQQLLSSTQNEIPTGLGDSNASRTEVPAQSMTDNDAEGESPLENKGIKTRKRGCFSCCC